MTETTKEKSIEFDQGGGDYPDALYAFSALPESEYVESLPLVTEDDITTYREQGFLAVRSGISDQTVRSALSALRDVARPGSGARVQYEASARDRVDSLSPPQRLDAIRKIMYFVEHSEILRELSNDPLLLSTVEAMLGGAPRMYSDQAFHKPPGGREKPWHQDHLSGLLLPVGTPIVGVWIALDEATVENGCMCVIRRSHRLGAVRHVRDRDLQICDHDVDLPRGVAIPLDPGGLLFFDGLVHHGTAANHSTKTRRSLQFHYTLASARSIGEEEYRAAFGLDENAQC